MKLPVLLSLSFLLAACGGSDSHPKVAVPTSAPIVVRAAAVATAEWPETYEATGSVRARSAAALSSRVAAYVQQVSVNVGDRVRQGQTLVTLDARDLETSVRRAEAARAEAESAVPEADQGIAGAKANFDLSQATFRRIDELASKKSVSSQELDEATARLQAARAAHEAARAKRAQLNARLAQVDQEIRAARIMRDYARIAAPFDGVVTAKSVDPGILAAPGAALLTVEREGGHRLEVSAEESRLASIRVGQSVPVTLDDRALTARVSEIVPAVDPASRTYIVKLDLPSAPAVRSGVFGRALFPTGARRVLVIPLAAIVQRGQLQQVFAIEAGQARLRIITAGRRNGDAVEVLSGLAMGERIVVSPAAGLSDGVRVEVLP